jgi:ribosomal protein S18 acetylase RimI-like enzyme
MPSYELRAATPDDLDVVLHHRREMFREMGGAYQELLEDYEAASRDYFARTLARGGYHGILAVAGDEVIAGGGVVVSDWPGSPGNLAPQRAWILNIYVEHAHRRQGIAEAVTRALMAWCVDQGFTSVALHASQHGRGLYEKLGFVPTNEMRADLQPRGDTSRGR